MAKTLPVCRFPLDNVLIMHLGPFSPGHLLLTSFRRWARCNAHTSMAHLSSQQGHNSKKTEKRVEMIDNRKGESGKG